MHLTQLSLINWANLEARTYPFAHITMITGDNGHGKTTLLDAIQVLMTAGHHDICRFNAGQEDTAKKRGKVVRNVASYVLGCDETQFARPTGAHGYVIGVFEPGHNEEAEPFTAIVGFSAGLEITGSQRTPRTVGNDLMLVLRGQRLDHTAFYRERDGRQAVVPVDEAFNHLRTRVHDLPSTVPWSTKRDYLADLHGALRGQTGPIGTKDAEGASKLFARFLAYRPVDDIDTFVRQEILEPVDITDQLKVVTELIQRVDGFRKEAALINQALEHLSKAQRLSKQVYEGRAQSHLAQHEASVKELARAQREHQAKGKERDQEQESARQAVIEEQQAKRRADDLDQQIKQLNTQLAGIDVVREKEQLERERSRLTDDKTKAAQALMEGNHARRQSRGKIESLLETTGRSTTWSPGDSSKGPWRTLLSEAVQADGWDSLDFQGLLNSGASATLVDHHASAELIERTAGAVHGALQEMKEGIHGAHFSAMADRRAAEEELKTLDREIAQLEGGGHVAYPGDTDRAIALIRDEIPGARPRVVCEHIDVADPEWQLAIEGLFGNARFDIVVDQDFEAEAIGLIRSHRRDVGRAVVVQTHTARRDAKQRAANMDPQSVVHLMHFSDADVRAYVTAKFAGTLQVGDDQTLTRTRSGLTKDGKVAGGYRMSVARLNVGHLVFGAGARARALAAKIASRPEAELRCTQASIAETERKRWYEAIDVIQIPRLSEPLTELLVSDQDLANVSERLGALDLGEHAEMEARRDQLEAEIKTLRAAAIDANGKARVARDRVDTANNVLKYLAGKVDDAEAKRDQLVTVTDTIRAADTENIVDWDARLRSISSNENSDAPVIRQPNEPSVTGWHSQFEVEVERYNTMDLYGRRLESNAQKESLTTDNALAGALLAYQQTTKEHDHIKDDLLSARLEGLKEASERFSTAFIVDVCSTLHNKIEQGRRYLNDLNATLQVHRFGDETYQFAWEWKGEMHSYATFFQRAAATEHDGNSQGLFSNAAFTSHDKEVRQELEDLFLNADGETAKATLRRLADYRNYRQYDVKKVFADKSKPHLSLGTNASGSGGQTENPAYVILAAAMHAGFRWGEPGAHLRMVMIDESFKRLDPGRANAVIDFLTKAQGLQLVFALPPDKAPSFRDRVDLEYQVAKIPSDTPVGELGTRVVVHDTLYTSDAVAKQRREEEADVRAEVQSDPLYSWLDTVDEKASAPGPGPGKNNTEHAESVPEHIGLEAGAGGRS